jgi:hypothetical protein
MRRKFSLATVTFIFILSFSAAVAAQETGAGVTGTQVSRNLSQVLTTMTGGTPISDVTLSGTFQWTAGSEQHNGSITMTGLGTLKSRLDLIAGEWRISEIRSDELQNGSGVWMDASRNIRPIAVHNALTDATWFFPPLSALASISDPSFVFSYLGTDTLDGTPAAHFRYWRKAPGGLADPAIRALSTVDLYIDSNVPVPIAVVFNTHPDGDANTNLPVKILYSDYRVVNGIRLPFHIRKYLNGALLLDLTVTTVQFNTGLSASAFTF